jgi:hypothetical protein
MFYYFSLDFAAGTSYYSVYRNDLDSEQEKPSFSSLYSGFTYSSEIAVRVGLSGETSLRAYMGLLLFIHGYDDTHYKRLRHGYLYTSKLVSFEE